jgi:hypothetical protein
VQDWPGRHPSGLPVSLPVIPFTGGITAERVRTPEKSAEQTQKEIDLDS